MARISNHRSTARSRKGKPRNSSGSTLIKLAEGRGTKHEEIVPRKPERRSEQAHTSILSERAASACFSNSTAPSVSRDKSESLKDLLAYKKFVGRLSGDLSRSRQESSNDAHSASEDGWRIREVSDAEASYMEAWGERKKLFLEVDPQPDSQADPSARNPPQSAGMSTIEVHEGQSEM